METMQGRSAEENGAPALFLAAGERGTIMRTYTCTQEEQIRGMMERPIPRKKIGIVHLEMVKERRTLYGMGRFRDPREAAGMVRPLFERMDRELFLVLSLDNKLAPMALEIAAVGGLNSCSVDIRSIFKHAIVNNGAYVICFHNHTSGDCSPSGEDKRITQRIAETGRLLGIPLVDHIIIGAGGEYQSLAELGAVQRFEEA